MTLAVAWLRSVGEIRELIVASDSRLRGGYRWDVAPKIFPLPRNDCVIAFAGETDHAYPLMQQAINTTRSYDRALNRNLSLDEFKGHLVRVFDLMLSEMRDPPSGSTSFQSEATFLLAGFDWRGQRFRVWNIRYDTESSCFRAHSLSIPDRGRRVNRFQYVGDHVADARRILIERLRARDKWPMGGIDMEPLTVLAEMIKSPKYDTIGGFPQVTKVYRSLNVMPFCVLFDDRLSLFGRPLLGYEVPDLVPTIIVDQNSARVVDVAASE